MKNDAYTSFVARAAARSALTHEGVAMFRTQEHALRVARNDFDHGAPPFKGGFNTDLARRLIAEEFASASEAA